MDDNTKEVLILLITTASTFSVGWFRMRAMRTSQQPPAVQPPQDPGAPPGV